MRRIKLIVAYDGTEYSGWQIQPEAPTIEMYLDKAIRELTGENVHVTGASRTDAGVHAYGNVAVFNTWRQIHICTKQIPAGFNCYSGFMGSVCRFSPKAL